MTIQVAEIITLRAPFDAEQGDFLLSIWFRGNMVSLGGFAYVL
jgi:hypothetical protein